MFKFQDNLALLTGNPTKKTHGIKLSFKELVCWSGVYILYIVATHLQCRFLMLDLNH